MYLIASAISYSSATIASILVWYFNTSGNFYSEGVSPLVFPILLVLILYLISLLLFVKHKSTKVGK